MPRRVGGAGLDKHLIYSLLILIPLVAVAPVLLCDLPLLRRGILPLSEAFQLGILINLYPEFDDDCAPVMKFFLELIDLMVSALPVVLAAEASRSTITRPYQVRSKMAIWPVLGSLVQKRHR